MEVQKIIAARIKRLTFLLDAVKELERDHGMRITVDGFTAGGGAAPEKSKRRTTRRKQKPRRKKFPYRREDYKLATLHVLDVMKKAPEKPFSPALVGKMLRKEGFRKMKSIQAGHILRKLKNEGKIQLLKKGQYKLS